MIDPLVAQTNLNHKTPINSCEYQVVISLS
jgi:hypothetical protein